MTQWAIPNSASREPFTGSTWVAASSGGKQVGHVTDACYSPRLKKNIGYVWVPIELAEPGHELELRSPDGPVPAVTAALPFWDPNKDVPKG